MMFTAIRHFKATAIRAFMSMYTFSRTQPTSHLLFTQISRELHIREQTHPTTTYAYHTFTAAAVERLLQLPF
jgi:hypothetical protein